MQNSFIPKLPRVTGFSKRLFILIGCVVFAIIVLFLYFLHRYTPEQPSLSAHHKLPVATEDGSDDMIDKITHQKHPIMNAKVTMPNQKNRSIKQNETSLSNDEFKQAGNSAISVYHPIASIAANNNQQFSPQVNSTLRGLMKGANVNTLTADQYVTQNRESEKTAFLHSSANNKKDIIDSKLQHPISPYEINAGTLISAILETGINSDLPGTIFARVSRNVYDTATGNYCLIPQGTELMGKYDSRIAYGQQRVLIVWNRLIFPDGDSFDLSSMPGADLTGMTGLQDKVDNHYFKIFGSALMMSLFGSLGQLSQPHQATNQLTTQQMIYAAIGQQLTQTGSQLIAKNMNIQPTIKIRPGDEFNVLLMRDMVLPKSYYTE